ncbi:MAG TPA: CPBP family glutamic-type intramembrane protease [Nitrososphaeraceae archaeon]|nr:CPBP family glutamic-type intramembrane protease [Nitrososphaeraceae archaeon]
MQERITKIKFIAVAIGIYLVWIFATYLLEGRINLLQKPNPLGRLIYAVIANMIIGTVIAIWLLRPSILQRFVTIQQLGFQSSLKRVIIAVVIAGLLGFALFVIQKPASLNAIVILNVFSQTLPGSIAEVVICWAVVGTAFESLTRRRNNNNKSKITPIIMGAAVAIVLFGLYHFAHSPPFNQPNMVLFIMYPGVLTSIVYFVGRDIYAAIVFHNFQALFGVMNNVTIEPFTSPLFPLILLGVVSVLVLIGSDMFMLRRMKMDPHIQR